MTAFGTDVTGGSANVTTCVDIAVYDLELGPETATNELGTDNEVSRTVWAGKADLYHAVQATLVPRLPLTPVIAPALAAGLLD